ncbi:MAG: Hsp33 family molecular chaperone HslO [Eubacteriaceae bacterium]|nr:Hsp33 family molecular chaperone HslO [Eubacteriaceae bacterium]
MGDKILNLRVDELPFLVFAVDSKETVEEARKIHNTSFTATAAVGRMISAVGMMTFMLKNKTDLISAQIRSEGPIKGITIIGNENGDIKIDIVNPEVIIPLKENGKLDVAGGIGKGTLTVIRDLGLKQPYVGTVDLVSSEIGDDFTNYFAISEQIPSVVALGVLIDADGTVMESGGFMIQLLPNCPEETIEYLEKKISGIESVTALLKKKMTILEIMQQIFSEHKVEIVHEKDLQYKCDCSRERFKDGLLSLGKKELKEMADEDHGAEVVCHFCNTKYNYSEAELKALIKIAKKH